MFVNRLLAKGQALKEALEKDNKEASTLTLFDTKVQLTLYTAQTTSSAGGAFSGTSQRKPANPGRGGGGRGGMYHSLTHHFTSQTTKPPAHKETTNTHCAYDE